MATKPKPKRKPEPEPDPYDVADWKTDVQDRIMALEARMAKLEAEMKEPPIRLGRRA